MLLRVKPTVFLQRFCLPRGFLGPFPPVQPHRSPPLLLPRPRGGGCRGVGAALRGCSLKAATPTRSDTITALLDVVGGTPLHPRRSLLKLGGTTQRPVLPPAPPASHKATEGGQRLHPQSLHPPPDSMRLPWPITMMEGARKLQDMAPSPLMETPLPFPSHVKEPPKAREQKPRRPPLPSPCPGQTQAPLPLLAAAGGEEGTGCCGSA